jgi:hypothetical protein
LNARRDGIGAKPDGHGGARNVGDRASNQEGASDDAIDKRTAVITSCAANPLTGTVTVPFAQFS